MAGFFEELRLLKCILTRKHHPYAVSMVGVSILYRCVNCGKVMKR